MLLKKIFAVSFIVLIPLASVKADELNYKLEKMLPQKNFFTRIIERHKTYPFVEKAERLKAEGKIKEAINEYEKYLKIDPEAHLFLWKAITLSENIGDYNKIEILSNNLLKKLPEFYPAQIYRGVASLVLGNIEQFKNDFAIDLSSKKDALLAENLKIEKLKSAIFLLKENDKNRKTIYEILKTLSELDTSHDIIIILASMNEEDNNLEEASRYYEKSFNLGGRIGLTSGINASFLYMRTKNWQKLKELSEKLLSNQSLLTQEEINQVYINKIYALAQTENKTAILNFAKTILGNQNINPENKKAIAYLLLETGETEKAIELFWDIYDYKATSENALSLANALIKHDKTGAGTEFLERSLINNQKMILDTKLYIHNSLGYLYFEMFQPQLAIENWTKAFKFDEKDELKLNLAMAHYLVNDHKTALNYLNQINLDDLADTEAQINFIKTMARVLVKLEKKEDALVYYQKLLTLEITASNYMETALLLQDMNKEEDALEQIKKAVDLEPKNTPIRFVYVYMLQNLEYNIEASKQFEIVLEQEPDYLTAEEDLAYTYMKIGKNQSAIKAFINIIDNKEMHASMRDFNPKEADEHIFKLRRQNQILDEKIKLLAYTNFCPFDGSCNRTASGVGDLANEAFGGIEFSYRPEKIGYLDGKILKITARTFWGNQNSSWIMPDEKTITSGLGVSYKPLKDYDLNLSIERLFKIGSNANNNTLTRISYGLASSLDIPPDEAFYSNYYSLYFDIGKYLEKAENLIGAGEARIGKKIRFASNSLAVPFAFLNGSFDENNNYNEYKTNIGLGVLYRHWHNEKKHFAPKSYFEVEGKFSRDLSYNRGNLDNRLMLSIRKGF